MVRKFTEDDLEEVMGWFHSRKIEITPDYLPQIGFISPGIAAGFIYQTDANFCIFESFISNPNTTKDERNAALNSIVTYMIQEAKELGFSDAYGFATSQSMIRHGMEQGFRHVETCNTIICDLREYK
jgi:hypothetical protein